MNLPLSKWIWDRVYFATNFTSASVQEEQPYYTPPSWISSVRFTSFINFQNNLRIGLVICFKSSIRLVTISLFLSSTIITRKKSRCLFRCRASISKQSSPFFFLLPRCNYTGSLSSEESQGTLFPFDPDRIRSPITRFPMLIFRPWRRKEEGPEEPKVLWKRRRYRLGEIALWGLARALINDSWPSPFLPPPHCSTIPPSFHCDESLVTTTLAKLPLQRQRCRFYFRSNYLEIQLHNFQLVEIVDR